MADDTRVFLYSGPVVDGSYKAKPEAEVSPANALEIVRAAFFAGRLHVTDHFRRQAIQRRFDLMDAEIVISVGELRGKPEFCPDYLNWKIRIIAAIEEGRLEVVLALDPAEAYDKSPLIILITGYWR
jgi:hypothetical protein